MSFIDSHCHLDMAESVDFWVENACKTGVLQMISVSTHVGRGAIYQALAERFAGVYFSIGTHPHHAQDEAETDVQAIRQFAGHEKCVAIGEAGLDYHYPSVPAAERVFRTHIALARELDLPMIIHAREADVDMMRILQEEMRVGRFRGVLHCFTSSQPLAEVGLALGLFISFSGVVTFKNSGALRAIARSVPLDRLLIETDAPYLAPVPYRGQRNEPAFVVETARILAQDRGLTLEQLADATSRNTRALFTKIKDRLS